MGKRVLLAVNARARRARGARDTARAAFAARGHAVTLVDLHGPGELAPTIAAYAGRVDLVAVAGGDGTLLGAIPGLRETRLPLLVLPTGTINELARTLGIPFDVDGAAALADVGVPRAIDVGCVNGTWFFDEASIGLSTRVAKLQTGPLKRRWGMLAIPVATLRALRWMRPFLLEVEDERGVVRSFRTVQLTVANSYRFGGVVENPEASLVDGRLWLYAIDVRSWREIAGIVVAVLRRRFPQAPGVTALRGHRFVVRSPHRRRAVYTDGERASTTPAVFTVENAAVTVLVPPSAAATRSA